MRIDDGYLVTEIEGDCVIFPVGQNVADFKNIITINESGRFIIEQLVDEISYDELLNRIIVEYQASSEEYDQVKKILDSYLSGLRAQGLITE